MHSDLLRHPLLRSAFAIAAAIWLLGGAAEHAWHAAVTLDTAHGSVSSASAALAVNADHAQCDSGLSLSCPVSAGVVDLPRWDAAFVTLGVLAAVAMAGGRFGLICQSRRGPPRGPAMLISGSDLLTRFCLVRR